MSSKTQYRDALKRANRTIYELKQENNLLNRELGLAKRQLGEYAQESLQSMSKKWWQFWK